MAAECRKALFDKHLKVLAAILGIGSALCSFPRFTKPLVQPSSGWAHLIG
jgi:hypothetical protein